MKRYKLITAIICLLLLAAITGFAKSDPASKAHSYFKAKQYEQATRAYAELLSKKPDDSMLNYYYGLCLLLTTEDKSVALPFLKKAAENPKVPTDVWYYLGRSHHLTGNYDEAIGNYEYFSHQSKKSKISGWEVHRHIEMCLNAKAAKLKNEKVNMIDSSTATLQTSFSRYKTSGNTGKHVIMPDKYKMYYKGDQDDDVNVFLSASGKIMYMTGHGKKTKRSLDIFRLEKDASGKWSDPVNLGAVVNTYYDEAYPTSSPDGNTLYFSSKGHNSMGGYDIFKSVYNTETKTWSEPENITPVNSPYDDMYFIPDSAENVCWFTSARNSAIGKVTTYKSTMIIPATGPMQFKGKFIAIGNPDLKDAIITIDKIDEPTARYEIVTDASSGEYEIALPGPGQYRYTVQAKGTQVHAQNVTYSEGFSGIIFQEIRMSKDYRAVENISVMNFYDGKFSTMAMENEKEPASLQTLVSIGRETGWDKDVEVIYDTLDYDFVKSEYTAGEKVKGTKAGVQAASAFNEAEYNKNVIIFKVQVGAFKKQKHTEVYRLWKNRGVALQHRITTTGWTMFYSGIEKDYLAARCMRDHLREKGFKDAFVVAFRGNMAIKITEALKK